MEVKKKKNFKLDYKKLAIFVVIMVILIVSVVLIAMYVSKNHTLNFDTFEKVAIYSYLEDDLLDVATLYNLSGNSDYNEMQVFQSKLKQALDSYFASNSSANEVSTSEAMSLVDSKYIPSGVDFHGIIVSDYTYNPENDTFTRTPGANANIAGIEAEVNSIDYSDKKASVQNIEKTSDDKYKVIFNIVNSMIDNPTPEATGEAILSIKDDELNIDSCTINE